MFTLLQPMKRIFSPIQTARKSTATWWLTMSDQEQKIVVRRGITIAGAGLAFCMILPVIGVNYESQRADAEFRHNANLLAEAPTAREAASGLDGATALMEHSWVRAIEYSVDRNPRAALGRYAMRDRDGAAVESVIDYRPDLYDRAELAAAEYDCLTQAVYYEAGYERTEGKLAVAEVIVNRVADHRYPNSVCDVVYQGSTRTTGCQFTFTCDGALRREPNPARWDAARTVAAHVLMDLHERRTASATHYHANYVDPIWNVGLVRTNKIGAHIFYRFPRGSEWAAAREAVARKKALRAASAVQTVVSAEVATVSASEEPQGEALTSTTAP